METEEGHRRTHCRLFLCIGSIQGIISLCKTLSEVVIRKLWNHVTDSLCHLSQCLTHSRTGHFAFIKTTHTITDHEHALVCRSLSHHGVYCIFLVTTISQFINGLWLM